MRCSSDCSSEDRPRAKWTAGLKTPRDWLAARAAAVAGRCLGPCGGEAVGILMYHRVAPATPGVPTPTWNVTPETFRRQMEGLLARGYEPWSLHQLLEQGQAGGLVSGNSQEKTPSRRAFVVTFDDGYECVHCQAWPVLRQLGIPATVFLATAYLDADEPFPFDDWALAHRQAVPAESYRPLRSDQCAEMLADGLMELGAHTHTHADFRGRPEDFHDDLLASLKILRGRFGIADATFAFPFGFAEPALTAAAREAGARCSLTTQAELVLPGGDPFHWGRLTAEASDTAATLAGKLDGWYSLARSAWLRLRGRSPERPGRELAATEVVASRPEYSLSERAQRP
jgi:peptidoglycan/xylan/chitin deacetylase (PgdA/CDA1 family)